MAVRHEQQTQLAETRSTQDCQQEAAGDSGLQPLLSTPIQKRDYSVSLPQENQKSWSEQSPPTTEQRPQDAEWRHSIPEQRPQAAELRHSTPEQRPQAAEWRHSTPEQRPQDAEWRHSTPEQRPQAAELRHSTPEQRPQAAEWRHSTPEQRPQAAEWRHSTPEQRPQAAEWRHSTPEQRPQAAEWRHSTPEQRPQAAEWRHSTPEQRPQAAEWRHSTPEQRPQDAEWRHSTPEQRPQAAEWRHSTPEQRPQAAELRHSTPEQRPQDAEWRHSTSEQRPQAAEWRHSTPEQRPQDTEWRLSTHEQRPPITELKHEQRPSAPEWGASTTERRPEQRTPTIEQRPSNHEQGLFASEWGPSTTEQRPKQRPPTIEQRPQNEQRLSAPALTTEQRFEQSPPDTEQRHSTTEQRHSTTEQGYSTIEQRPSQNNQRLSAPEWPAAEQRSKQRPPDSEQRHSFKQNPPTIEQGLSQNKQRFSIPKWGQQRPEQRPPAIEQRHSTTEQRYSTTEQRQSQNEQTLSAHEWGSLATEQRPPIIEQRPSQTEQRLSAPEWGPSTTEPRPKQRPQDTEQRHSTIEHRPSKNEQRCSASEWGSSTTELRPEHTTKQRYSIIEQGPPTTEQKPSKNEQRLCAPEWGPSTTEQRLKQNPPIIEHRPSNHEQRPPAPEWGLSTTEQRPPIIKHRPSNHEQGPSVPEWGSSMTEQRLEQRPPIEWRPLNTEQRPPTIEQRYSTIEQRPSTTEWRHSAFEQRHYSTERRPPTTDLTAEQRPSTTEFKHEQRPSATKRGAPTIEQRPEQRPTNTDLHASTSQLAPSLAEDRALTLEKAIAFKYTSYVKRLQSIIEAKEVSPELLRYFILSLSDSSESASETKVDLEKCTTISEIFAFLSTECATFLNNKIFEEIIKRYEINDEEVLQYSKDLEKYVRQSERAKTARKQKSTSSDSKRTILKIGMKSGQLNIDELKLFVEKMLSIPFSKLEIVNFQDDSDTVTFLIPAEEAFTIFSPSARFSLEQVDEFQASSVLWLECNGYTFRFKNDHTDNQQSHPSDSCSKQVPITIHKTHTQISTITATTGSSSDHLATDQLSLGLPSEWENCHNDSHNPLNNHPTTHPAYPDENSTRDNYRVSLRATPDQESNQPDVHHGPLHYPERNYDCTNEKVSQPLQAGAATSEGRSHPRTIRHCTNSYPGASSHSKSVDNKLSLQDTENRTPSPYSGPSQHPKRHSDAAVHPISFAVHQANTTDLFKTDHTSAEYSAHNVQDTAAILLAGYAQAVANQLGHHAISLSQKPFGRNKTEPQLGSGRPIDPVRSQTQVHCREAPQHQFTTLAQNPSTSTPQRHEGQLPAYFAGVNDSPCPEERDSLDRRHYTLRHKSSTATESSEEGSLQITYSEPSLMSSVSVDHPNHSFHHSHSQGSDMSGSLGRSSHKRTIARQVNHQTSRLQDYNFSQGEISMRNIDSVKRLLDSGSRWEQDEYIAVLIRQQFAQSRDSPWKVVFTVCRRNPCCIEPLLALLNNRENKKVFTASAFTVKFITSPQNPGQITLTFPTDMKQQGYDVVSDYTPCTILKNEASQSLNYITATHPPRCEIRIIPLHQGNEWKPLRASLKLEGTDDSRKFMLTNPEIIPVSHMEPTNQVKQQDGQSNTWPELEPNSSENNLIKRIINEIQLEDHWTFGVALGVPMEDLRGIITGQSKGNHPSITMYEIFACWDKKVIDPSQRSWEQVVHALNAIGYITLLNDITAELDSR